MAIALQTLEISLNAADPRLIVKSKVSLNCSLLEVQGCLYDLNKYRHIYVIGGGKASGAMAEALEEILSLQITEGIVNVPYGSQYKTNTIVLNQASHPVPDQAGVKGTQMILEIAEKAGKDDLVICLISGGGSSLMPSPRGDISLADKQELTNVLLRCGARHKRD